jgi:glycosyltransferase involved in cell wall biosynthesis
VKVAYVIPTHFDNFSVIAGAERYAYGLAKAMAKKAETVLVTFSDRNATRRDEELTIKYEKTLFHIRSIINPFCVGFLRDLADADVIHCLQFRTVVTELAVLYGALRKRKVFVTDLAGGTMYSLSRFLPVSKGVHEFLLISEYSRRLQPPLPVPNRIIYGGVDENMFCEGLEPKQARFLYAGRIFPLKGIHHLIEALPQGVALDILGHSHDDAYLKRLQEKSAGKRVTFRHDADDASLIHTYRQALATVLPSLVDGGFTAAIESLACGTPVLGTKLGSLPEIVDDGVTGFLVPPNDPSALHEKMAWLVAHPESAAAMGRRGRDKVLREFTWDRVVDRCLAAYGADYKPGASLSRPS